MISPLEYRISLTRALVLGSWTVLLCGLLACHMPPPIDVEREVMDANKAKREQAKLQTLEDPSSQAVFEIKSSKPKDVNVSPAKFKFTYAAGSFTHQQNAESLAKALADKGLAGRVENETQQDARYYRVLLEVSGTEAEAKAKLDELGLNNPQLLAKTPL